MISVYWAKLFTWRRDDLTNSVRTINAKAYSLQLIWWLKLSTKMMSQLPGRRLFCTALLVGIGGSFHLGYQLTLTNPSQDAFLEFVQDSFENHYGIKLTKQKLEVSIY